MRKELVELARIKYFKYDHKLPGLHLVESFQIILISLSIKWEKRKDLMIKDIN